MCELIGKPITGVRGVKCMTLVMAEGAGLFTSYLHGHSCIFGTDPSATHNWSPEPGHEDVGSLPALRLPAGRQRSRRKTLPAGLPNRGPASLCPSLCQGSA